MGFWESLEDVIYNLGEKLADYNESQRASFERNYEHKLKVANRKLDDYEARHNDENSRKKAAELRERINGDSNINDTKRKRRTDKEFENDKSEINMKPKDFQIVKKMPLSVAKSEAQSHEGVYILYLNGTVMKCGRAAYGQGIKWRFTQYYNLNYDKRARNKEYWSITPNNRDDVVVSWQCCPASKCGELEYKLFKKYGKGPWAKRAPNSCSADTWELLI